MHWHLSCNSTPLALFRKSSSVFRCRMLKYLFSSASGSFNSFQMRPKRGDRVVIAMSGGVDSSVAARLLADQDFNLTAVYMRNWDTRDELGSDRGCEWEKDWEDVQRVCSMLSLPCEMVDLSKEYWNLVFEPSLRAWEDGDTPNPDIWCNREIKFGILKDHVLTVGGQFLATGHYCKTEWSPYKNRTRPKLMRASDRRKDQSYYLSALCESQLHNIFFPLQELNKKTVRELAMSYKLPTALRPESMGICFVGQKRRFEQFLSDYLPTHSGPIIDIDTGKEIAVHGGLWQYTIGQGARLPGLKNKMFVAAKDKDRNIIFVACGSEHPALHCKAIKVDRFRWIWPDTEPHSVSLASGLKARVQFRHKMEDTPAIIKRTESFIQINFVESQKGVAPGQVVAVYDGNWCLGSGVINSTVQ